MPDEPAIRAVVDSTLARLNLTASEEERVRLVGLLPALQALAQMVRLAEAEHGEAAPVFSSKPEQRQAFL